MGATVGTRLMTWWKGREVGQDAFGNRYFTEKSGGNRRWVIYEGLPILFIIIVTLFINHPIKTYNSTIIATIWQ